jgi:phosphatidylglycerophosphate synthase
MNSHAARPSTDPAGALWLPQLARDAMGELGIAAALLLAFSLVVAQMASLGPAYPGKVMALYGVGALIIWRGLLRAHPHPRFGPGNRVTLGRFAMSALLAGLVGEANASGGPLAWALVVAATLTALLDAADGMLARRSGLTSRFGARFDMETDAWLTLVLCLLLLQFDKVGAWVLAAGLMRYAFVAAACVWPWLAAPLPPSRRRQGVCVLQITVLIVCLGPIVSPLLAAMLAAAGIAALTLSFVVDLRYLVHTRTAGSPMS